MSREKQRWFSNSRGSFTWSTSANLSVAPMFFMLKHVIRTNTPYFFVLDSYLLILMLQGKIKKLLSTHECYQETLLCEKIVGKRGNQYGLERLHKH